MIDLSPMNYAVPSMHRLAGKIERKYGAENIALAGIGIDGYLVAKGIGRELKIEPDFVEIKSNGNEVICDKEKMDSFLNSGKKVVLVDKRSKTGRLGDWISENYPDFAYCTLVNLSGRPKLYATKKDIKWFRWGEGINEAYKNAYDVLGLKIDCDGSNYKYSAREPQDRYFLDALYRKMDNQDLIMKLFDGGQIAIYPEGIKWKDKEIYHYRFEGRKMNKKLLKPCAERLYALIKEKMPEATHACGIPSAGVDLAKAVSGFGLGHIAYGKSWHGNYDLVNDFEKSNPERGAHLRKFFEEAFVPHGTYGKLEGDVGKGAEVVLIDNVSSATCASKIEAEKILGKLLKIYRGLELGKDVNITGVAVLQNNSPYAYDILGGRKFVSVFTATDTLGTLKHSECLDDNIYPRILDSLFRLGWFSAAATRERVGDIEIYNSVRDDFEALAGKTAI